MQICQSEQQAARAPDLGAQTRRRIKMKVIRVPDRQSPGNMPADS